MTRIELEEFKNSKLYFTYIDIQAIFNCGRNRAYDIIKSVRKYSNALGVRGKITVTEFDMWFNQIYLKYQPIEKTNEVAQWH